MPELVGVRRNLWMTRAPGGFRRMNFSIDGLVLFAPLWHPELKGSPFLSKDLNAHTLTVTGATWGLQGRSFAGAQFIKLNDGNAGSPLNFTTQDFTIIVWYNPSVIPTTDAASMQFLNRGLWSEDGYLFWLYTGPRYRLITAQLTAYQNNYSSTLSLSINTWYMAGIVRKGTSALFYHNGLPAGTGAVSIINPTSSTKPTRIGTHIDEATYQFKGKMGEVLVYNRAFASPEMLKIHQATKWRYA